MIELRDDDVLVGSSGYEDSFKKFKQVHRWACETDKIIHVPTILVTEIQAYPECIEYVKEETAAGRMRPEIHGFKHIDYGKLEPEDVRIHLKECQVFFNDRFNVAPTRWYTPWGASAPHLHEVAKLLGLKVVDCSNINELTGKSGIIARCRAGEDPSKFLEGKDILYHWWLGGLRLKRLVEVLKHGTWEKAKEANKEIFEDA
jgi:hypothetical protein